MAAQSAIVLEDRELGAAGDIAELFHQGIEHRADGNAVICFLLKAFLHFRAKVDLRERQPTDTHRGRPPPGLPAPIREPRQILIRLGDELVLQQSGIVLDEIVELLTPHLFSPPGGPAPLPEPPGVAEAQDANYQERQRGRGHAAHQATGPLALGGVVSGRRVERRNGEQKLQQAAKHQQHDAASETHRDVPFGSQGFIRYNTDFPSLLDVDKDNPYFVHRKNEMMDHLIAQLDFVEFLAHERPIPTSSLEMEWKRSLECSVYVGRKFVEWEKALLRPLPVRRPAKKSTVGSKSVKVLQPHEAAQLWLQNRPSSDSWTVTESDQSIQVQGFMINHRFYTNRSGSFIHIGSSWMVNTYKPFHNIKSIRFTDKGKVAIEPPNAALGSGLPKTIDPKETADFIFMWRLPYGFAGTSVYPLRQVSFLRNLPAGESGNKILRRPRQ